MDANTMDWTLVEWAALIALAGIVYLSITMARLYAARTKREREARLQLRVEVAVITAVQAVQQLVERLKAASPTRQLTPDQQKDVRQMAVDEAKRQLGTRGLADVAETFEFDSAAVEQLFATWIEAAVYRLARGSRVTPDAGTAGDAVPFVA
jgi:type II secretory pathway component PulM